MEAVMAIVLFFGYFLPTVVSSQRRHRNGTAIFVMNLLLGWTLVGWIIALIWSFSDNVKPKTA